MKKKSGFTLAEVLITMVIIGVVAALAAPILSGAFQKSKVGPSIRKIISTLENANELILHKRDSDRISYATVGTDDYISILANLVKGSVPSGENKFINAYSFKDYNNNEYTIENADSTVVYSMESGESLGIHKRSSIVKPEGIAISAKGIWADLYYDMNGFEKAPNKLGKDVFAFVIDDTGSVIPIYSKSYSDIYLSDDAEKTWESTDNECTETKVYDGLSCAGSVADNGWKVAYKY